MGESLAGAGIARNSPGTGRLLARDWRRGAGTCKFAFAPDLCRLTPAVVLGAVGQALFALGISAGIMIAYGAYMPAGESLKRAALAVIGSIFAVSLLATVAIFPLVFHYGLNPAGGPQLVFEVLPVAFAEMPGGRVIGTLFFALLVLAAFTPSVGMMEPWVAWLSERAGLTRRTAAVICLAAGWLLGQGSVLAFGRAAHWHPLGLRHPAPGAIECLRSS